MLARPTPRALIGNVRANADAATILAQIQSAVVDFKANASSRLDVMETGLTNMETALNNVLGQRAHGIMPGTIGDAKIDAATRTQFRAAMLGNVQASMELGSGPDGGYTVPTSVDNTILSLLRQSSALRQMATVVKLGAGSGSWKKIITRSGSGSLWAHELETRVETATPQLGAIEVTPQEIYAIPEVTNHVLEDSSFNLEQFLSDDVAAEFSLGEGAAFINGDGIKKPLGLIAAGTTAEADNIRAFGTYQHVPTGAAGDFGAQPQDNLIDLIFKLPAPYRSGEGVGWFMNSLTASRIKKLKDTTGRLLWQDGLDAGQPSRLLGYNVNIDENFPDIAANALSIAFGNWRRGYAIVDKVGMKLLRDPFTKKGWVKFYFSKRVGGAPLDTNAIKFLKFSVA